jgi:dTDP-4-dehydrorhamnose reductase
MDIANPKSVETAINAIRPWALVNTAAFADADLAELHPLRCFRENVIGARTLARICATAKIPILTFSSHLVFDGDSGTDYVESDRVGPLSIFGLSKTTGESEFLREFPAALIVRSGPHFGPWDRGNFVSSVLSRLLNAQPVLAADDLHVSPTYVPDLVHASLDLLVDGESGIWHLANSGSATWAEIAAEVAVRAGLDEGLIHPCGHEQLAFSARRPRRSSLRSERAQLLGGWKLGLDRYFNDRGCTRTELHCIGERGAI